jgi:hypothetical protein
MTTAAAIDELVPGFVPETDLERALVADPELLRGLGWGTPRFGHPEGRVGRHVAAILEHIGHRDPLRGDLRVVALLHDSFKWAVRPGERWSRENDHAFLARRFAERFTSDDRLLVTLELHDEPYWIWQNQGGGGAAELAPVLDRIPDVELFVRFLELDASTEGKDLTLLWWVRRELAAQGKLPPRMPQSSPFNQGVVAGGEVTYIKEFTTDPDDQREVAEALALVVREGAELLAATGEVLVSDDGVRVLMVMRWRGSTTPRLLADGEIVRRALRDYPVLTRARPRDAHVFSRPE